MNNPTEETAQSAPDDKAPDMPVNPPQQQQHLLQLQQQVQRLSQAYSATTADPAYEADDDDDILPMESESEPQSLNAFQRRQAERQHIYELFQPWALKNYGDQAKTKTITLRKKARILKALEGKEHSRPDSSKFRFWVRTKAFTTKRPADFEEAAGGQRRLKPLPPNAVLSDNPSDVDLFVASTNKDLGKRTYRKVAVVEEFFDIIYNVHMELGGRSGMHAGQKRTYRIITETYAFLPREAVTRFLSICPECKKNLRAISPATSSSQIEEPGNESSSELEALNYSSLTESSVEATASKIIPPTQTLSSFSTTKRRYSHLDEAESFKAATASAQRAASVERPSSAGASAATLPQTLPPITITKSVPPTPLTGAALPVSSVPKIRVRPQLQKPLTPPPATIPETFSTQAPPAFAFHPLCYDMNVLKSRESFFRYYEFMRRFYSGGLPPPPAMPTLATPPASTAAGSVFGSMPPAAMFSASDFLQNLNLPVAASKPVTASATKEAELPAKASAQSPSVQMPTESDPPMPPAKKFKTSPDSLKRTLKAQAETQTTQTSLAPEIQQSAADTTTELERELALELSTSAAPPLSPPPTQVSAINLSKQFFFRTAPRTNGKSTRISSEMESIQATSTPVTSTPSYKCEPSTSAKAAREYAKRTTTSAAAAVVSSSSRLPPLDLERLKPITSTYLQLTRSMGLSDEDALRFDNLVSEDFDYEL